MTNSEIIQEIDNLINQHLNYCDFIIECKKLNKKYKKTVFYKQTKISIIKLINMYRMNKIYNILDLDYLFVVLQEKIEDLNVDNLIVVLNKLQEVMSQDFINQKELFNSFKSILSNEGK